MLIEKIKLKFSDQFIRNIGWLGAAELVNRVFRLVAVIFLARLLSPQDYGLAAIVLTTFEFANILTFKSGITSKLVQANEEDFDLLCDTAYWMNWIFSVLIFILQCLAAFPIAWFYGDNRIILPLCIIGSVYLTLPLFTIQAAILTRQNRLEVTAVCNALQGFIGNILTVIFAFIGLGLWAFVLPIIFAYPIWVIVNRMHCPWRHKVPFTLYRWREIAGFATNISTVELLNKLRANLDYLLVGRFLGIEALGLYYFAFNAGIGISLNIISAFTISIFPHICLVKDNLINLKERYFSSIKTISVIILPLIILQSMLAPFYVPILYGQKWITAIPILVIICLSALPRPFADAASMLLQTVDKTKINLYWNLIFTVILATFLIVAVNWGIFWVAVSVLVAHIICLPIFSIWANRYVFSKA